MGDLPVDPHRTYATCAVYGVNPDPLGVVQPVGRVQVSGIAGDQSRPRQPQRLDTRGDRGAGVVPRRIEASLGLATFRGPGKAEAILAPIAHLRGAGLS